jgi:hypothetical protein
MVDDQKAVPAPPVEVEGEMEFEVEEVVNARLQRGKLEFLVKWEGYTPDHNTWEPEEHLKNAKEKVDRFYKKNPGAPQKLNNITFTNLIFKPYENFTRTPTGIVSCLEVEI